MAFETPRSFPDAMASHDARVFLPPGLRATLTRDLPAEIKQRSFFISGITQAEILQKVKDQLSLVIDGKMTESEALSQMRRTGDLLDQTVLEKDARLKLVLSTNADLARGFGQWRQGESSAIKEQFPAQEFYRAENRKEPRDWPKRWEAAGGKFYPGKSDYPQGRMIAFKDDPIWSHISAFGLPYPPFDYNSGMGLRDITAQETKALEVSPPPGFEGPKKKKRAPIVTQSSRRVDLAALTPAKLTPALAPARVNRPIPTGADQFQAQEAFIAQQAQEAQQVTKAQEAEQSFNHTLQAKPELEDDSLVSVLQALFAPFAVLGQDEIFREIDQEDEQEDRN
jgi:hypothetical protein